MRHRNAHRQLGRSCGHRRAMLRNLVTALFKYGRIETTEAKAKELTPIAEKMITLAKRADLHSRRQTLAYVQEKTVAHRLFEELKERFLDRQGGYVRVMKKGFRKGDGAPLSVVELIGVEKPKAGEKKIVKTAKKGKSREKVSDKATPPGETQQNKARGGG